MRSSRYQRDRSQSSSRGQQPYNKSLQPTAYRTAIQMPLSTGWSRRLAQTVRVHARKVIAMIIVRREQAGDEEQIRTVNTRAFQQTAEANIIDALRSACPEGVSLVAVDAGIIVGHILFTPAVIESESRTVLGMGLAPMAVLPEFQRRGIGSRLIRAGLDEMRKTRQPFVLVLGHPEYYPRFGFVRASRYGIISEYEGVPDEAFMILVLDEAMLEGVTGIGKYRPEFAAAT